MDRKRIALAALGAGMIVVAAGCGGGGGGDGSGASASGDRERVEVTAKEFEFASPTRDFEAGVTYEFVVKNDGEVAHEMMIIDTMHNEMLMESMEEMDEMAFATIPAEELVPGATRSVEVTFDEDLAGTDLELACLVPGHHDSGMHLPINVA